MKGLDKWCPIVKALHTGYEKKKLHKIFLQFSQELLGI